MISLSKKHIPPYLRDSVLYHSLCDDEYVMSGGEDSSFSIPIKNCKMDEVINSQENLVHLFHTIRYWGISGIPASVRNIFCNFLKFDWTMLAAEFSNEYQYLEEIAHIYQNPTSASFPEAIRSNILELVLYLEDCECEIPRHICITAAESGSMSILHHYYILKGYKLYFSDRYKRETGTVEMATTAAAKGGHLECLQFVHEQGCSWNADTTWCAAQYGHLDCLKYAHEHGCPCNEGTTGCAAHWGHLSCLKYLHEHGYPWDVYTTLFAARCGQLDCLNYAHEHGCPWDLNTTLNAARCGHLDCLNYAHEHGCPGDVNTTLNAAQYGHLDCLKYAYEHGCPCDEGTTSGAAYWGHLDCLKYLHEQGCPWDVDTTLNAARCGQLDCLNYAHEHGCP